VARGSIVWVDLDPTRTPGQPSSRTALIVSSEDYLRSVDGLVIIVPITTVDRGWPHHVEIEGDATSLRKRSFAMTEQPRTIAVERIARHSGTADDATMSSVDAWLRDFIAL
jgi:mRNA interferase MazF